ARRILRPGGVFMQWLPLHQLTPLDIRSVLRTQAEVFPETFVVRVGDEDFVMVSYPRRPVFSFPAIRRRCEVFERERLLQGTRWRDACRHEAATPEGVLSLLVTGPEDVAAVTAPAICRDDNQLPSYSSGDRWLLRRYQGPFLANLT